MRRFAPILLLLACPASLAAQNAADEDREAEAVAVVRAFHRALASGDSLAALSHLHPDVSIYESGHAEDLSEYRAGHLPADIAFAAATRREVTDESASVLDGVALYTSESRVTGRWRDREIDARGTETIVLEREGESWKIRHVHWSSRGG